MQYQVKILSSSVKAKNPDESVLKELNYPKSISLSLIVKRIIYYLERDPVPLLLSG